MATNNGEVKTVTDVVCFGVAVVDIIARYVNAYPERGELISCDSMTTSIGGCAANTAIGIQKLGVNTAIIAKTGHDNFGDFIRETLIEHGVNTRGMCYSPSEQTASTMVIVNSDGERSFIYGPGAGARLSSQDIDWNLVKNAKVLHIGGHFLLSDFDGIPCAQTLRKAQEMGIKTSIDTAWDANGKWMETLRPSLPYLDYFMPSFEEAQKCVGEKYFSPHDMASVFIDAGVKTVAITMGEHGCFIMDRNGTELRLPTYDVQVADTNGAGDAFAAGFLAGISYGFDLEKTGKLANATGACSTTGKGGIAGLRSLEETLQITENLEIS